MEEDKLSDVIPSNIVSRQACTILFLCFLYPRDGFFQESESQESEYMEEPESGSHRQTYASIIGRRCAVRSIQVSYRRTLSCKMVLKRKHQFHTSSCTCIPVPKRTCRFFTFSRTLWKTLCSKRFNVSNATFIINKRSMLQICPMMLDTIIVLMTLKGL